MEWRIDDLQRRIDTAVEQAAIAAGYSREDASVFFWLEVRWVPPAGERGGGDRIAEFDDAVSQYDDRGVPVVQLRDSANVEEYWPIDRAPEQAVDWLESYEIDPLDVGQARTQK